MLHMQEEEKDANYIPFVPDESAFRCIHLEMDKTFQENISKQIQEYISFLHV